MCFLLSNKEWTEEFGALKTYICILYLSFAVWYVNSIWGLMAMSKSIIEMP